MTSEDDLAAAIEGTDAYVTERQTTKRRVVLIGSGGSFQDRKHGQNTDSQAGETLGTPQPGHASA